MCSYSVNYQELNVFLFAQNHFPERTPNCWELVSQFVRSQSDDWCGETPTVCIGKRDKTASPSKIFNLKNKEDCRSVNKLLCKSYPSLFQKDLSSKLFWHSGKSAFKPIILLPPVVKCCSKTIKMDNRPLFPLVYTMTRTYVGVQFHGQCYSCGTTFFPSYKIVGSKRIYYDPTDECTRFFNVTSKTVFDKQLLKDDTNNIWVNGATFQSLAKVYNLNFADSDKQRLSEPQEFAQTKEGGWRLNEDRVLKWCLVSVGNCQLPPKERWTKQSGDWLPVQGKQQTCQYRTFMQDVMGKYLHFSK